MAAATADPPTSFATPQTEDRRLPAPHPLFWRVAASATILLCAVLHWWTAREANAPRTPWDENHVLQMARFLSGDHNVTPLSGAGYYPGWSFIMAPIWWFTHDAAAVYAAAIVLGNIIALATIIPLALTARHFGLTTPQALTVGALAMCLPARTVNADYVLAEKPLMFFLAWVLLAAVAVWKNPTWWRMVLFSLAVTATFFVHARALTVVLTAAVWLVFFVRRRLVLAVLGLAVLGAGFFVVRAVSAWIHSFVLLSGFGQGEQLLSSLLGATPANIVRVALNQVWAQFVGTAGLFAIGIVVIGIWAWREIRTLHVGIGGLLLGLTLITVFVSVASWADSPSLAPVDGVRFDANIYTRYIDPIATLVALVGLVALLRAVSRPIILTALAAAVATSLLVVFWVARNVPTWGNLDGPANSAAILTWDRFFPTGQPFELPLTPSLTNPNRFWIFASVFLVLALAAYLVLRAHPRILVTLGAITLAGMSVAADPSQFRDYPDDITWAIEDLEASDDSDDLASLDFDKNCRDSSLGIHQAINWLPYWLSPREVSLVDLDAGERFDSDVVVSCDDWPRAAEFGALAYEGGGTDYNYRVWILPGELQDELDAAGKLLTLDELAQKRGW